MTLEFQAASQAASWRFDTRSASATDIKVLSTPPVIRAGDVVAPILVQIGSERSAFPLVGADARLISNTGRVVATARTDRNGRAELVPEPLRAQASEYVYFVTSGQRARRFV